MTDKLASLRTRSTFAPQPPSICSARFKFVPCRCFRGTALTVGVAASRDLRGVGRRLEKVYLGPVRADSR